MHRDGAYWSFRPAPRPHHLRRSLLPPRRPHQRPRRLHLHRQLVGQDHLPQRGARAHPDRDKTRGRIWRVKPKAANTEVADFTKMSTEELVATLGNVPVAKAHLAWQTIVDRWNGMGDTARLNFKAWHPRLEVLCPVTQSIRQKEFNLCGLLTSMMSNHSSMINLSDLPRLLVSSDPMVRTQVVSAVGRITDSTDSFTLGSNFSRVMPKLMNDSAPTVRQALIKSAGHSFSDKGAAKRRARSI